MKMQLTIDSDDSRATRVVRDGVVMTDVYLVSFSVTHRATGSIEHVLRANVRLPKRLATAKVRVYVAATFGDWARARTAMTALRAAGIEITHDWTAEVVAFPNDDAPKPLAMQHAREDLDGVRTADAVLVLTPDDKARGCGMWIEMGAALALGKPVIVCGPQRGRSIFCELADARFEHDADAVAALALASAASPPSSS